MTLFVIVLVVIGIVILSRYLLSRAASKAQDGGVENGRHFKYYDPETFYNTYALGLLDKTVGEDVFFRYMDASADGQQLKVYDDEMAIIEAEQRKTEEFNEKLRLATANNNEGIDLEKKGDVYTAIAKYEENILPSAYFSLHPYHRLCVLYRKFKDYENEIRVIETCLARPEWKQKNYAESKERAFFEDRLAKAKSYQTNTSK